MTAPTTLGELARRTVRRLPPAEVGELPYIGLEHLAPGQLRLLGWGRARDMEGPFLRADAGDVLLGALRPHFRKLLRAPFDAACSTEAWVLKPAPGVDPGFLLHLLATPALIAALSRAATGTRMPRADWGFAARVPVAPPGLAEQRRLAAPLEAMGARVDLHLAMNLTLEDMARALARHLLTRPRAGALPEWLDRVREVVDPTQIPPDTPAIGLEHLPRRATALLGWGQARDLRSPKLRARAGDLLFAALRPGLHKVIPCPRDAVVSQDLLVLRPRPGRRWVALAALSSDAFIARARAAACGTRMPRVRWRDLCQIPAPDADAPALDQAEATLAPLYQRALHNAREALTLIEARDALAEHTVGRCLQI